MRMKVKIGSTLVLLTTSLFVAQAQDDLAKNIKSSFKAGNLNGLADYMGQKLEVAFESEKKTYSRDKAEQVLGKFFTENKPKDFQVLHQGASKDGLKFYIGEYSSNTGTFRVLVYLRNIGGKQVVETIDISKE
jgi:hypothetical protein